MCRACSEKNVHLPTQTESQKRQAVISDKKTIGGRGRLTVAAIKQIAFFMDLPLGEILVACRR